MKWYQWIIVYKQFLVEKLLEVFLKKDKSEGEDEKQIIINEKGIAWH